MNPTPFSAFQQFIRPRNLRRRLLLTGCALYFVAFAWTCSTLLIRPAVEDYFESRRWQIALEQSRLEASLLDKRAQEIHERTRAQNELCRDLIAGRITLAQAGHRLRELPNPPDDFLEKLRFSEEGATEDERLCNHIIERACDLLRSEPARSAALREKLRAELHANAR
jgi:hypothetical protein